MRITRTPQCTRLSLARLPARSVDLIRRRSSPRRRSAEVRKLLPKIAPERVELPELQVNQDHLRQLGDRPGRIDVHGPALARGHQSEDEGSRRDLCSRPNVGDEPAVLRWLRTNGGTR